MTKRNISSGIPIAVSLVPTLEVENIEAPDSHDNKRILRIAYYAVVLAICISFIAKILVYLIEIVTNLAFYGNFSAMPTSPAGNHLGWWVIIIPAIGGAIVGVMALYGSKAIRGHGIPEAMEQVLTNQSKIKPAITFLKPISSAIAIGTGGPFGAEGPIIATGGALGSTLGQLLKITHNERKVLLAAGATAGMAAIFGSPIAAIFLAIELLLFEFSPRSIIPVALACITGAAGHHFLFSDAPVFFIKNTIEVPSNIAVFTYSIIGIVIGVLAVIITKAVYWIEDMFEKLPVHWMWWPAIGGLIVGLIGYFAPRTLGVGYENISALLTGDLPLQVLVSLCIMKFLSWAIALGSGTSGGTLAPLLTIGGATGALAGAMIMRFFPQLGVTIPLAALVGMSAMFAGASRALLTSIIFALETTSQSNSLLPLLAACTGSYIISFSLMKNTIMTEKIARRGIKTPDSYESDILEKITVGQVVTENGIMINETTPVAEVQEWLRTHKKYMDDHFLIVNDEQQFKGIISSLEILQHPGNSTQLIQTLIEHNISIPVDASLRSAVEALVKNNVEALAVTSNSNNITGVLSYRNILQAYKPGMEERMMKQRSISLKRQGLKILLRGTRLITSKGPVKNK